MMINPEMQLEVKEENSNWVGTLLKDGHRFQMFVVKSKDTCLKKITKFRGRVNIPIVIL